MTLRNSWAKRPPFPFSHRARVNQLVCDPRPYVRAWAEDGRPLWANCLAWSPGPAELGVTGDGQYPTLYGSNWLAQICQDGTWRLYQRITSEELEVIEWDVKPPTVAITARHPSLAFDQAAKPVIAWEDADGVRLREFNEVTGQYHFIGPFPGCDPVLLCDATVNYHVPDSDVVLFYLNATRSKLMYRVQNENYSVEHEHYDFAEAVVLDGQDIGGYRFQLRFSNEAGAVIGSQGDFQAALSDVYPIYVRETATAGIAALADGEYLLVVQKHALTDTATGNVGALADGLLAAALLKYAYADAATGAIAALGDGSFTNVILTRTHDNDLNGAVASLGDGLLALAVITRAPPMDEMLAGVGSLGDGTYAAA